MIFNPFVSCVENGEGVLKAIGARGSGAVFRVACVIKIKYRRCSGQREKFFK
jgi:hypothetical protein